MSPAASCTSPATLAACFLASPKARLKSEFWVRVSGIGCSLGKSVTEQRPTSPKVRQPERLRHHGVVPAADMPATEGRDMDEPKRQEPEIPPPRPVTEPQRSPPEIPNIDPPEKSSPTTGEN